MPEISFLPAAAASSDSPSSQVQFSRHSDRRRFLAVCSAAGLGQTLFPGALLALAAQPAGAQAAGGGRRPLDDAPGRITAAMIDNAAAIAGITIADDQKAMMLGSLNSQRDGLAAIRELNLPNSVPPAFIFDPVPGSMVLDTVKQPMRLSPAPKLAHHGPREPRRERGGARLPDCP